MNDVKFSRYLSYILRHNPSDINITLDNEGYCEVETLLKNLNKKKYNVDLDYLKKIVKEDNKGRYSFSGDMTKIRANQGHSVTKISFEEAEPPDILYHGTAKKYLESILEKGIVKGNRHHVHMSSDIETASRVGKRHGDLIVLIIDSKKMREDNIKFYISENGVYLCDYIAPKYFKVV